MASSVSFLFLFPLVLFLLLIHLSSAARNVADSQEFPFLYHNGVLLSGKTSINLIWYGRFKPSQRAIVTDFVASLSSSEPTISPSVNTWWKATDKFYQSKKFSSPVLSLGSQILDEGYSLGKHLTSKKVVELASKGGKENTINVVLTSNDVAVEGFCSTKCGTHDSASSGKNSNPKFAYIWVGNSDTQCPGHCAWPFHTPIYGPQSPPLVAPNNDVGMDGMVINLASLLAGTVTNPFGNGYFQGHKNAPLEVATACSGVYGKGAYPGYAGDLLVDTTTGASFNAQGVHGRKFLLPALFDPLTSKCSPLV